MASESPYLSLSPYHFRGRFKSQLVEDEKYLRVLLAYIHLNPVEARLVSRLTEEAWTSHRIYMGKEEGPMWLTTDFFLGLFGAPDGLHRFVMSIRRKRIEYPEDFNPETGLFKKRALKAGRYRNKADRESSMHHRLRPADEVLKEVCHLTGAQPEHLRRTQRGPRANPARRFAIWALNRSADISQREIGKLLDVPYHQVTRLLGRMRRRVEGPVTQWMNEWISHEPS